MAAYYNENDPKAAAWLRELIKAGLIAAGDVDERSIAEVRADELTTYTQCHFFAGIGGWSYALRLAGVPDDEPVWTGSCPCQPFSAAGKQRGVDDERHLWPNFRNLIADCSPPIIFGEQVASKLGREWLAGVRADLERLGYAVGAADLCAAGVGAPHIRQRLYWLAHASGERRPQRQPESQARNEARVQLPSANGEAGRLAYADGGNASEERQQRSGEQRQQPEDGGVSRLGDTHNQGSQRRSLNAGEYTNQRTPWEASELVPCLDGKSRRIEPGTFPLANGVSGRVGLLRGYGNAIVPQVAAEFIKASLEAIAEPT